MNVLITGGLGYIGGRIASYLKEKNPDIHIFLTTRKYRKHFPEWAKSFTIVPMDLLDEQSIQKCVSNCKPNCVIHLAAMNEIDSVANPELAQEVNYRGTEKILQAVHANGAKRFIYFSTFHVYNKGIEPVITEQTLTQPSHPYAVTHLAAEKVVVSFRDKGMNTLIFRLSNVYGYPMDKEINRWMLLVNDLCRQVVVTNRIFLKSSWKQYRDFISLHDVARAVDYFLFTIPDAWEDGFYNLGGNCTMSILEIAHKVSEVYCKKYHKDVVKIETPPKHTDGDNPLYFSYSINKLMATGFHLKGDIEVELSKTMDVCEEFLDGRS